MGNVRARCASGGVCLPTATVDTVVLIAWRVDWSPNRIFEAASRYASTLPDKRSLAPATGARTTRPCNGARRGAEHGDHHGGTFFVECSYSRERSVHIPLWNCNINYCLHSKCRMTRLRSQITSRGRTFAGEVSGEPNISARGLRQNTSGTKHALRMVHMEICHRENLSLRHLCSPRQTPCQSLTSAPTRAARRAVMLRPF